MRRVAGRRLFGRSWRASGIPIILFRPPQQRSGCPSCRPTRFCGVAYRHMNPTGQMKPDGEKLLGRKKKAHRLPDGRNHQRDLRRGGPLKRTLANR